MWGVSGCGWVGEGFRGAIVQCLAHYSVHSALLALPGEASSEMGIPPLRRIDGDDQHRALCAAAEAEGLGDEHSASCAGGSASCSAAARPSASSPTAAAAAAGLPGGGLLPVAASVLPVSRGRGASRGDSCRELSPPCASPCRGSRGGGGASLCSNAILLPAPSELLAGLWEGVGAPALSEPSPHAALIAAPCCCCCCCGEDCSCCSCWRCCCC